MSDISRKALIEWLEAMRDGYEHSPLTVDVGKHHAYNITINRLKSGRFDLSESEGEAKYGKSELIPVIPFQSKIFELQAENEQLKRRIAELEDEKGDYFDRMPDEVLSSHREDAPNPIIQATRDFMPTQEQRAGYEALIAWLESTTPFREDAETAAQEPADKIKDLWYSKFVSHDYRGGIADTLSVLGITIPGIKDGRDTDA